MTEFCQWNGGENKESILAHIILLNPPCSLISPTNWSIVELCRAEGRATRWKEPGLLNHGAVPHPQNTHSKLVCEQEINFYCPESLIFWGYLSQQLHCTESTFMSIERLSNLLMVTQLLRGNRFKSECFVFRKHVINCYLIIFPFSKLIFIIRNIIFFYSWFTIFVGSHWTESKVWEKEKIISSNKLSDFISLY